MGDDNTLHKATVLWFNKEKRIGFVALNDGSQAIIQTAPEYSGVIEKGTVMYVTLAPTLKGVRVSAFDIREARDDDKNTSEAEASLRRWARFYESDTHFAVVKSYSPKKGYGVITLSDGIAVLHAEVLGKVWDGVKFVPSDKTNIKPETGIFVKLIQGQGGRMVSEIVGYGDISLPGMRRGNGNG